jgi:predicted acetyltransferase
VKITVLNKPVEKFQSTWEGVVRERVKQWAVLEIDGLPTAFQLTLDPGKEHKPGDYTLATESFVVTNGRLTMSRAVLVPIATLASASQPAVKGA